MTRTAKLTTRAERESLRSIKRICYAGLDSTSLRQEVALRAAAVLPADGCGLMSTDPATGLFTHGWTTGLPERFVTEYRSTVYPDEATTFLDLARSGRTTGRRDSAEFLSLLRGAGFEHSLHAVLCSDGELWGAWCHFRQGTSRSFRDREERFLRAAAPHVANGLRAAASIEVASSSPQDASLVLGPGVLVLDEYDSLRLRSGAAAAQLEDLAAVGDSPRCLPFAVASVLSRLSTISTDADPHPLQAELRAQGRSGRWYVLRASLAEPGVDGASARIVVIERAAPRRAAVPLAELYGLSPRQNEVVLQILRGESTKSIASRLGLSPHTIQDHLDLACEKIGVRGRRALVARIIRDAQAVRLEL